MSDNQNQSEQTTVVNEDAGATQLSELEMLKSRARMMNIVFSNNIGVEALQAKIQGKLDNEVDETDKEGNLLENQTTTSLTPEGPNPLAIGAAMVNGTDVAEAERVPTLREWLYENEMRLVRCRITNLDPKKKDLQGEIFTIANEYLGTVRKFIPYGEHTEKGFHIPHCMYELLRSKKFLNIRTGRDRKTGTPTVSQNWAQEFALEVLEPLTPEELAQLAQAQIAAGSLDDPQGDML